MERRELPQQLKNLALQEIQRNGLDFRDFRWEIVRGPWSEKQVSQLTHPGAGFFMTFDFSQSNYAVETWPALPNVSYSFPIENRIINWIRQVAPELKAPDLWKLAGEQAQIDTDPANDNAPFTPEEQKRITAELFRLEDFVYQSEPTLPPASRARIKAHFNYLREAVGRLGKIDWKNIFVAQIVSLVTNNLITSQTATALYNTAATALNHVLSLGAAAAAKLLGG